MSKYDDIIKVAAADIGYTESPANSNKTKYGKWYGMDGQPWCMMAVQYWHNEIGKKLPYRTASCSALLNWYKDNRPQQVKKEASPGFIVIYNFGHTGIVVKDNGDGTITAIEGNTSPNDNGSQDNGGGVYKRIRSKTKVSGFIDGINEEVEEVTQEQFNKMMDVYLEELGKKEPSNWSKDAREWAEGAGVINGDENGNKKYKKFCTREELVQILFNMNNE